MDACGALNAVPMMPLSRRVREIPPKAGVSQVYINLIIIYIIDPRREKNCQTLVSREGHFRVPLKPSKHYGTIWYWLVQEPVMEQLMSGYGTSR